MPRCREKTAARIRIGRQEKLGGAPAATTTYELSTSERPAPPVQGDSEKGEGKREVACVHPLESEGTREMPHELATVVIH
jgi:hypothetical protein